MDTGKVAENVSVLLSELGKKAPNGVVEGFINSVSLSSTMGPGVWVDIKEGE